MIKFATMGVKRKKCSFDLEKLINETILNDDDELPSPVASQKKFKLTIDDCRKRGRRRSSSFDNDDDSEIFDSGVEDCDADKNDTTDSGMSLALMILRCVVFTIECFFPSVWKY